MLTGQLFTLKKRVLTETGTVDSRDLEFIPEGATVEVVDLNLDETGFVAVRWQSKNYLIFLEDLEARSEPI